MKKSHVIFLAVALVFLVSMALVLSTLPLV